MLIEVKLMSEEYIKIEALNKFIKKTTSLRILTYH